MSTLFIPEEELQRRFSSVVDYPWPERLRGWILSMEVDPSDPYGDIHTVRRQAIFIRNQIDAQVAAGPVSHEQATTLRALLDEKVAEMKL